MEKRIKRLEIGMIVIIVFQLLILFSQMRNIAINRLDSDIIEAEKSEKEKELPREFNSDVQKRILNEIRKTYNEKNYHEMHEIFSDYAQLQIDVELLENEFSKLKDVTGSIIEYIYSYYEYDGFREGASWYDVYYKSKFDNGHGNIIISIRVVGANWGVIGIKINLEDL